MEAYIADFERRGPRLCHVTRPRGLRILLSAPLLAGGDNTPDNPDYGQPYQRYEPQLCALEECMHVHAPPSIDAAAIYGMGEVEQETLKPYLPAISSLQVSRTYC